MFIPETHLTRDDLVLYASKASDSTQEETVEEHLLICQSCRNQLGEIEADLRIFDIMFREWQVPALIQ